MQRVPAELHAAGLRRRVVAGVPEEARAQALMHASCGPPSCGRPAAPRAHRDEAVPLQRGQPARVQTLCAVRAGVPRARLVRAAPACSQCEASERPATRAALAATSEACAPADRPNQASGPGAAHTRDVRAVAACGASRCDRAARRPLAASSRPAVMPVASTPRGRPRRLGWRSRSPPRRPARSCAGRRRGGWRAKARRRRGSRDRST